MLLLTTVVFLFYLGTEFKSASCPLTSALTYLEIQRGAKKMPDQPYHRELGATASCSLRLAKAHLACRDQQRCGIKGDSWFGSVKACLALLNHGVESVFQIKTSHKMYPKKFIEETMEGMPGGVHLVLEGIHQHTEERLIAIGYCYSTRKTLFFVMSPGAGSTRPGEPYEMKYPTEHDNVGIRFVSHPDVVSKYFQQSNIIDKHNQARQFELHLEKCLVTQDPYFRLHTTLLGMNVTDCWKLAQYHGLFTGRRCNNFLQDPPQSMTVRKSSQLLALSDSLKCNPTINVPLSVVTGVSVSGNELSSPSTNTNSFRSRLSRDSSAQSFTDCNGTVHFPVPFSPSKGARHGIKPRRCSCVVMRTNQTVEVGHVTPAAAVTKLIFAHLLRIIIGIAFVFM